MTAVTPYEGAGLQRAATGITPAEYPMRDLLLPYEAQIAAMLPAGVTFERVVSELHQAAVKLPALLKVPAALLIPELCRALATEGVIGTDVYLVPFYSSTEKRHEVTMMIDYKYKAALVVRAGGARVIEARAVYANEITQGLFTVTYGTDSRIDHTPLSPEKRGAFAGAYALARISSYVTTFHWMPLAEIEVIRAKSKQWSKGPCPVWYGKKSAVNQMVKLLPKSPRMRMVQELTEREESGEFEMLPRTSAILDDAEDVVALPAGDRPSHITEDGEDTREPGEEPIEDAAVTVALDVALAKRVGKQKTPLGNYSDEGLHKLYDWAATKEREEGDADGRMAFLMACCSTILDARARGEIDEPTKKEQAA